MRGGSLYPFLLKYDNLDTFMQLNTTLALYEGEEMDEMLECLHSCAELMLSLTMYYIQVLNIPFKRERSTGITSWQKGWWAGCKRMGQKI